MHLMKCMGILVKTGHLKAVEISVSKLLKVLFPVFKVPAA